MDTGNDNNHFFVVSFLAPFSEYFSHFCISAHGIYQLSKKESVHLYGFSYFLQSVLNNFFYHSHNELSICCRPSFCKRLSAYAPLVRIICISLFMLLTLFIFTNPFPDRHSLITMSSCLNRIFLCLGRKCLWLYPYGNVYTLRKKRKVILGAVYWCFFKNMQSVC